MTGPLIANREALAKVLHPILCVRPADIECAGDCVGVADDLLASGAVIDAATLADDEALVERVARVYNERNHPRTPWREGMKLPVYGWLRALAAALTERGERDG